LSEQFLVILANKLDMPSETLQDYITAEVEGDFIVLRLRTYLGNEMFRDILTIVKEYGGKYVSLGKKSHFKIPLKNLKIEHKEVSAPQLGNSVVWISVDCLLSLPFQVRVEFPEEYLDELAETIRKYGILEPLIVRPKGNGHYEIIIGNCRFKAAIKAELKQVPCIIKKMSDEEAYTLQMIENVQRRDLTDYEKARMLKYLVDKFNYTQEQLAEKLGKSQTWVARHLAILKLEDIMPRGIMIRKITEAQARAILSAPPEKQKEILQKIEETKEIPSMRKIEAETKPQPKEEIIDEEQLREKIIKTMEEQGFEVIEAPPEPTRTPTPYECSDCHVNTFYPTFLKDGRILCPTCLQYQWKKNQITFEDLAEEKASTESHVKARKLKQQPIVSGFQIKCEDCGANLLIEHQEWPDGRIKHTIKEVHG